MDLPDDWKEFLSLLNSHRVRFLMIGAHALAFHGRPRLTGDLDVLVEPTRANARRVLAALADFGFGSVGITESDLSRTGNVIALGQPPLRIDLLTSISGVRFARAWRNRVPGVAAGVPVQVLALRDFVANKKAAGRPKDRLDLELLNEVAPGRPVQRRRTSTRPKRVKTRRR